MRRGTKWMRCTRESGFGCAARTSRVCGPFACASRREDLREQFSPGGYAGQVLTRIDLRGESAASLGGRRPAGALPPGQVGIAAELRAGGARCGGEGLRGSAAGPVPTERVDAVEPASNR